MPEELGVRAKLGLVVGHVFSAFCIEITHVICVSNNKLMIANNRACTRVCVYVHIIRTISGRGITGIGGHGTTCL